MKWVCSVGLPFAVVAVLLPGCEAGSPAGGGGSVTSELAVSLPLFSPDGSVVAYLFQTITERVPRGPAPSATAESVGVRWCSPLNPSQRREVVIESTTLNGKPVYLYSHVHIVFSPDSRRLAVVSGNGIQIIDMTSAEVRDVVSGVQGVTSLGWFSKNEIVYGLMSAPERPLCRLNISTPQGRQEVFHKAPVDQDPSPGLPLDFGGYPYSWPTEYWSHAGQYCAYWTGLKFTVVEVATGRTLAHVGGQNFKPSTVSVSWKQDDSEVLLLSGDHCHSYQTIVFNPRTGGVLNFSAEFNAAFGSEFLDSALHRPGDTAPTTQWTADGKYFVVNSREKHGGFLICPYPWELIPIGQGSGQRLGNKPGYMVEIYPTSIAGWVLAVPAVADQEALIDYTGIRVVFLPPKMNGTVLSPDGTLIAAATLASGLIIAPAPALPSDTQPSTSAVAR